MKTLYRLIISVVLVTCLFVAFSPSAYAITEEEVQSVVNSQGREAVSGNVFIWFLCAIAFLKMSQKIDSFMSSLGINVGHTGGSMLAEGLIAARTISQVAGGKLGGSGRGGSGGGGGGDGNMGGFMSSGLAGAVGRSFSRGAANSVTGQSSGIGSGITKAMFNSSLSSGGKFATNVTSSVARGRIASAGSMTGETATTAFTSYMGISSGGSHEEGGSEPVYSGVEIGGGRITGFESTDGGTEPIQFAYYSADQYSRPDGDYNEVAAVDDSKWYRQYARNTVEKTPYMTEKGSIEYSEKIVSSLPAPPRRKDRI